MTKRFFTNLYIAMDWFATLNHEMAHALAAFAVGAKTTHIYVGSQYHKVPTFTVLGIHFAFTFDNKGGRMWHSPVKGAWRTAIICLAGPLADLTLSLGGCYAMWEAMLYIFSLQLPLPLQLMLVAGLYPLAHFTTSNTFSFFTNLCWWGEENTDGKNIYNALKGA